jgi:hypothetical protein
MDRAYAFSIADPGSIQNPGLEGVQGDENPLGLPPEEGRKGGESKVPTQPNENA